MRQPASPPIVVLANLLLGLALVFSMPAHAADPSPPRWNVVAAGAASDATADATAVFQRLLDEAGASGGGLVEVPAGRYRIDGNLVIPAHVTLQGAFRSAPNPARSGSTNLTGTVLLARTGRGSAQGPAFIRLAGHNAGLAGLIVEYPEWRQSEVPPIPYPPAVASQDTENVFVQDCCFLNPYEAIRFVRAHRHLIRNVTGYPAWRGIFVDECYDIGRIENVHFWPFGVNYEAENPYCRWVNTQGVAFEFARTDWQYVANTFCFGYGVGYRFSASSQGSANGNFSGLGADSCQRAVLVEQAQPPGLLISNGEFVGRWGSTNSVGVEIAPTAEGKVSLVNCAFWGPIDRCVWMRAPAGQFTASACHFVHWNNRGADSPAIQLDAGRAIVQGCTFAQDDVAVAAAPEVLSAILTANQAIGGFRVENGAGSRVQSALNEPDPVAWTDDARTHYRLTFGAPGDGRYLRSWHGPEKADRPFRWSFPNSQLVLPTAPGQTQSVTLVVQLPAQALAPDAGIYLGDRRLAEFRTNGPVAFEIPPTPEDRVRLEVRCRGWEPRRTLPGSTDHRTLGIQLFSLTSRSPAAPPRLFDANTGAWLNPSNSPP